MPRPLCFIALAMSMILSKNMAQRQLVPHRRGGRALVLVTLDGFVTALNPDTGDKQVRLTIGIFAVHDCELFNLIPPSYSGRQRLGARCSALVAGSVAATLVILMVR